jgi:hypothetical protein
MVLQMSPVEHALRKLTNFAGWTFPTFARVPRKPLHPDGDIAFTRVASDLHPDSERIIAHMSKTGGMNFRTGSVVPDYDGKTDGVVFNVAKATDPVFTVSTQPGKTNLWVSTGYKAPYGAKVRIGRQMIPQGYPMSNYSDCKLHVYDPFSRTVTEIQYIELIHSWVPFFGWLFGGGYRCHGVKQYSLDAPSTSLVVQGASAANVPLAETDLEYEDVMHGHSPRMTVMAVPAAHKDQYVWPATATDGPSSDPDAVRMGMVLRLKNERLFDIMSNPSVGPQTKSVVLNLAGPGVMVVDTGSHISPGLALDPRWDQDDLAYLKTLRIEDFEVYTHRKG